MRPEGRVDLHGLGDLAAALDGDRLRHGGVTLLDVGGRALRDGLVQVVLGPPGAVRPGRVQPAGVVRVGHLPCLGAEFVAHEDRHPAHGHGLADLDFPPVRTGGFDAVPVEQCAVQGLDQLRLAVARGVRIAVGVGHRDHAVQRVIRRPDPAVGGTGGVGVVHIGPRAVGTQGLGMGQGLGRTGEEDAVGDPHLVTLRQKPLPQAFNDELDVIRQGLTPTGLGGPGESRH